MADDNDDGNKTELITEDQEDHDDLFDQPEGTDWFLAWVISYADNGVEQGITLSVGGNLITGLVISGRSYFSELGLAYKKSHPENAGVGESYANFSKLWPMPAATGEFFPSHPEYIHLRKARIIASDGVFIPNRGSLWRCKLSAVDGFSLGEMSPS